MMVPMTCPTAEPLIARYVDDPEALGAGERQQLEGHLAICEACRVVLESQRHVARMLHARPQLPIPAGFSARLAARLDAEPRGWLGLANWRAWTVALAPVAGGIVLAGWLGGFAGTQTSSTAGEPFDTWIVGAGSGAGPAAPFLQASNGDVLLEAVLTGAGSAGDVDGR
jgi:anti-sigma factor RsiW